MTLISVFLVWLPLVAFVQLIWYIVSRLGNDLKYGKPPIWICAVVIIGSFALSAFWILSFSSVRPHLDSFLFLESGLLWALSGFFSVYVLVRRLGRC